MIDLLFDEQQPRDPRKAVQVHISRLRRLLRDTSGGEVQIETRPAGYILHAKPDMIDVHRFSWLIGDARRIEDLVERSDVLRQAFELRRGPLCADLTFERLSQHFAAHLDELVLGAVELRVETALGLGQHDEQVAELAALTAQHPTSERLIAARMLALYRGGRQREALSVYHEAAKTLAHELGLDPGPELQSLHTQILRNDPTLLDLPADTRTVPLPAQLPACTPTFTGRDHELAEIFTLCQHGSGTVVITAINGMAGVGKTTIALHIGHHLVDHYPDGQLFLDLRGHAEGTTPANPIDILESMLRSLGQPADRIPPGLDDRAALYRSLLSDKRLLVVLDDAACENQVRPLLPAASGCLALITSRRNLTGLEHAHPLSLDVLPAADAVALFRRVAGRKGLDGVHPALLDEVVEVCGRLPLAIQIAAARLRARPSWTLEYLVGRLRDERVRIGELTAGDSSVAAAIKLSYDHLSRAHQRLFCSLAHHPGSDVDVYAVAALADLDIGTDLDQLLNDLIDEHLLDEHLPGRYRFHDLVRSYALKCAESEDGPEEGRAALTRLLKLYLNTASIADNLLDPNLNRPTGSIPRPTTPVPVLSTYRDAMAWLDTERINLLASITAAEYQQMHDYTWLLANVLNWFFFIRGHLEAWISSHRLAVDATRELGDRCNEAMMLNHLGTALWLNSRHAEAIEAYQGSLGIRRELADRRGEAAALSNLGGVHEHVGNFQIALDYQNAALPLFRETGNRRGEANTLGGLASINERLGNYPEALDNLHQALPLFQEIGDRRGEATALCGLGSINERLENNPEALDNLHQALPLFQEIDDGRGHAHTLNVLGTVQGHVGDFAAATQHHERALQIAREVGDLSVECEILNAAGRTARRAGDPESATRYHSKALALATKTDNRYEETRAHDGLARVHPESERSSEHQRQAELLHAELGIGPM